MKIIALIYSILFIAQMFIMPFEFGKERRPYSPLSWLLSVIFGLPMIWLFWKIIIN